MLKGLSIKDSLLPQPPSFGKKKFYEVHNELGVGSFGKVVVSHALSLRSCEVLILRVESDLEGPAWARYRRVTWRCWGRCCRVYAASWTAAGDVDEGSRVEGYTEEEGQGERGGCLGRDGGAQRLGPSEYRAFPLPLSLLSCSLTLHAE